MKNSKSVDKTSLINQYKLEKLKKDYPSIHNNFSTLFSCDEDYEDWDNCNKNDEYEDGLLFALNGEWEAIGNID